MIGFASTKLGLSRERLAFWLAAGCGLVLTDGAYRLDRPTRMTGSRGPAPAPIPEKLAREAIAAGVSVRRDGDLFGRAA